MFLSDGEFPNVNKLIFMNENLYFDIIMMIEQTLVDQTAQAVARVLKIELSDHWPTMTAISSQSIKPPTALCNLYCWQNDTYSQQTLQITDIAEWYFSSLRYIPTTAHSNIIPEFLFLRNIFTTSYHGLWSNPERFFREMRDWLDKVCIPTIYYIVSQVLSYWSFMTHHWDFI